MIVVVSERRQRKGITCADWFIELPVERPPRIWSRPPNIRSNRPELDRNSSFLRLSRAQAKFGRACPNSIEVAPAAIESAHNMPTSPAAHSCSPARLGERMLGEAGAGCEGREGDAALARTSRLRGLGGLAIIPSVCLFDVGPAPPGHCHRAPAAGLPFERRAPDRSQRSEFVCSS